MTNDTGAADMPAFPHGSKPIECGNCGWEIQTYQPGMTLRDWFAGQSITGLLGGKIASSGLLENREDTLARAAYRIADALLAQRSKP